MIYTDGSVLFGCLGPGQEPPRLIDAPAGSRVRFRFRNTDLWRVYIKHENGDLSAWYVQWADQKANTVKLLSPFGQNVRCSHEKDAGA